MQKDVDIIGRGWTFPPRIGPQGAIALTNDNNELSQAIQIILSTPLGSRVMRPTFGCRLQELVFAPNNSNTHGLVIYYVKEALTKWEPRIQALKVDAWADTEEPNKLVTSIEYQVIATNNVYNLVYPFYLQKSP